MVTRMLIAGLVIGGITAYYFGIRPGVVAAVLSVGLFFAGIVMPSKMLWAYALVGTYTVAVLFIGPRLPGSKKKKQDFLGLTRQGMKKALSFYRKLRK